MSRTASRSRTKPVELFVSYAHSDAVWLGRLKPLLQFEHCQDEAHHWDDQTMKAGDRWDGKIGAALERMDVFVCLVSTEFLTSRYIRNVELPRALEREKGKEIAIVPIVIYRHVPLEDECRELIDFNPLPAWRKCWRDFEVERGDYGDAHGLIRAGLRDAIGKIRTR
jgi:TIR domain